MLQEIIACEKMFLYLRTVQEYNDATFGYDGFVRIISNYYYCSFKCAYKKIPIRLTFDITIEAVSHVE